MLLCKRGKTKNQSLCFGCPCQGWAWRGLTLKLFPGQTLLIQISHIAPSAVCALLRGPIISHLCQYHFVAISHLLNIWTEARASRKRQKKICQGTAWVGWLPWGRDHDLAGVGLSGPSTAMGGTDSPAQSWNGVLGPSVWGWVRPLRLIRAPRALTRMEKGYVKKMRIFLGFFFFGPRFQLCYGSVEQPSVRPRNLNIVACIPPPVKLLDV